MEETLHQRTIDLANQMVKTKQAINELQSTYQNLCKQYIALIEEEGAPPRQYIEVGDKVATLVYCKRAPVKHFDVKRFSVDYPELYMNYVNFVNPASCIKILFSEKPQTIDADESGLEFSA